MPDVCIALLAICTAAFLVFAVSGFFAFGLGEAMRSGWPGTSRVVPSVSNHLATVAVIAFAAFIVSGAVFLVLRAM